MTNRDYLYDSGLDEGDIIIEREGFNLDDELDHDFKLFVDDLAYSIKKEMDRIDDEEDAEEFEYLADRLGLF